MDRTPFKARALGCILAATALLAWPACKSRSLGNEDGGDAASGSAGAAGRSLPEQPASGGNSGAAGVAGSTGSGTGGTGTAGTGGTTGTAGTGGTTGAAGSGATAGASGSGGSGGIAGGAGGRGGTGGGSAGRGGTGGGTGGRGGAGAASPECTSAADCKLVDDCCSCEAIPSAPRRRRAPSSGIQSACAARQLPSGAVDCVVGKCVAGIRLRRYEDHLQDSDARLPRGRGSRRQRVRQLLTSEPASPRPSARRSAVCSACTGTGEACVSYQTQRGPQHHCVTIPPECNGNGGCSCVGVASCLAPYQTCTDYSGIRGVSCSCPKLLTGCPTSFPATRATRSATGLCG
jgi:hypothetical protein